MLAAIIAEALDIGERPVGIVLNANAAQFLLFIIIPGLVSLITHSKASNRVRAALTLVATAAVVLIKQHQLPDGSAVLSMQTLYQWALAQLVAVGAYLGFWKPVVSSNERLAPEWGVIGSAAKRAELERRGSAAG